jgi:hypothetical protein
MSTDDLQTGHSHELSERTVSGLRINERASYRRAVEQASR